MSGDTSRCTDVKFRMPLMPAINNCDVVGMAAAVFAQTFNSAGR